MSTYLMFNMLCDCKTAFVAVQKVHVRYPISLLKGILLNWVLKTRDILLFFNRTNNYIHAITSQTLWKSPQDGARPHVCEMKSLILYSLS